MLSLSHIASMSPVMTKVSAGVLAAPDFDDDPDGGVWMRMVVSRQLGRQFSKRRDTFGLRKRCLNDAIKASTEEELKRRLAGDGREPLHAGAGQGDRAWSDWTICTGVPCAADADKARQQMAKFHGVIACAEAGSGRTTRASRRRPRPA